MTNNWFEMWFQDKQNMLDCMLRNMQSDLDAGYNPFGNSILRQRTEINNYKKQFDAEMDKFHDMDESKVQRWCYYNMKKRGVI